MLHISNWRNLLATQLLIKQSKEIEVAESKVGAVDGGVGVVVVHNLPATAL